eukprot:6431815-Alexandrium_andersonii.AAC.1
MVPPDGPGIYGQNNYDSVLPLPCPADLGSVPMHVDVQPGVAASEHRDRSKGPERADGLQESPADLNFRDPDTWVLLLGT